MTYGLKVTAQDGSITQIDSDDNAIHSFIGTSGYGSSILVLNTDWVYPGFDVFANRTPSSGYWKSLMVELKRSPDWATTGLGSIGYNPLFDGGTGGNINLTSDSIYLGSSTSNQQSYALVQNGDVVQYDYLGSGSSIGGLTSGDLYYVRDKGVAGNYTIKLNTLSGTNVNLTSYSTDTSTTGNRLSPGGYLIVFRGGSGTTSTSYFSVGAVSDVTWYISAKVGQTSYSENLSGNYGLQIKNSSNNVVFDSRAYGTNNPIYPSVILQPSTRGGNPSSSTAVTSDYTLLARTYNTGSIGWAYDPYAFSYIVYGHLFYRNNTTLGGSGIKWMGLAGSFANPQYVDNVFGNYLVDTATLT